MKKPKNKKRTWKIKGPIIDKKTLKYLKDSHESAEKSKNSNRMIIGWVPPAGYGE